MEKGINSDCGCRPEDNLIGLKGSFNEESLYDNFKGNKCESLYNRCIFESKAGRDNIRNNKIKSGPIFILY